jgi:hypothetical protein
MAINTLLHVLNCSKAKKSHRLLHVISRRSPVAPQEASHAL